MNRHVSEQCVQVQKELAQKLAEAERIGERLIELGKQLKGEPWGVCHRTPVPDVPAGRHENAEATTSRTEKARGRIGLVRKSARTPQFSEDNSLERRKPAWKIKLQRNLFKHHKHLRGLLAIRPSSEPRR